MISRWRTWFPGVWSFRKKKNHINFQKLMRLAEIIEDLMIHVRKSFPWLFGFFLPLFWVTLGYSGKKLTKMYISSFEQKHTIIQFFRTWIIRSNKLEVLKVRIFHYFTLIIFHLTASKRSIYQNELRLS